MIIIKETQGLTLQGAIDGVNKTYTATYEFLSADKVNIYVNGRLKIQDWDDGFSVVLPNQVLLKEALLPGDSLEVEYHSGIATGGGADGGCPSTPETVILRPDTQVAQDVPEALTVELKPVVHPDDLKGEIFSENLRPLIVASEEN